MKLLALFPCSEDKWYKAMDFIILIHVLHSKKKPSLLSKYHTNCLQRRWHESAKVLQFSHVYVLRGWNFLKVRRETLCTKYMFYGCNSLIKSIEVLLYVINVILAINYRRIYPMKAVWNHYFFLILCSKNWGVREQFCLKPEKIRTCNECLVFDFV